MKTKFKRSAMAASHWFNLWRVQSRKKLKFLWLRLTWPQKTSKLKIAHHSQYRWWSRLRPSSPLGPTFQHQTLSLIWTKRITRNKHRVRWRSDKRSKSLPKIFQIHLKQSRRNFNQRKKKLMREVMRMIGHTFNELHNYCFFTVNVLIF